MAGLAFGMILLGSVVAGTIYFFAFRNVVIAPHFPAIFQPIRDAQKKCTCQYSNRDLFLFLLFL
jgi:hypothetical protein